MRYTVYIIDSYFVVKKNISDEINSLRLSDAYMRQ